MDPYRIAGWIYLDAKLLLFLIVLSALLSVGTLALIFRAHRRLEHVAAFVSLLTFLLFILIIACNTILDYPVYIIESYQPFPALASPATSSLLKDIAGTTEYRYAIWFNADTRLAGFVLLMSFALTLVLVGLFFKGRTWIEYTGVILMCYGPLTVISLLVVNQISIYPVLAIERVFTFF